MLPSIVRFAVKLKDRGKVYTLESPPSYPLVCITNESQWAEAVGKLLKEDVLNGEVIFPQQMPHLIMDFRTVHLGCFVQTHYSLIF